jgi:spore coat polysaccharide biosynthesis protein SpsF
MNDFKTEQEKFWMGEFGTKYSERNIGGKLLASNIAFYSRIMARTTNVKSVIEFGANIGLNLIAIKNLLPSVGLSAIEINQTAVKELEKLKKIKIYPISILDFKPDIQRDFVFTKGVLIHINPEKLPQVYDLLYQTSRRYICIAEYYNPSPVTIEYRGHTNKLFKRDFAGEIMNQFSDVTLTDYGFVYHRDNTYPQDDITWFLFEKHR